MPLVMVSQDNQPVPKVSLSVPDPLLDLFVHGDFKVIAKSEGPTAMGNFLQLGRTPCHAEERVHQQHFGHGLCKIVVGNRTGVVPTGLMGAEGSRG